PGLYAFVGTRPISNVDPLGLFPQFTHDELPPDWIYNNDIQYQFGNNLFGTPYYENLIPRITTDVWICVRPLRKAPAGGHAYLIVEGVKRGDHLWGYGGGPFTVFEGCEPKCGGGDQLRIQHGPYTSKKNAPPD